MAGIEDTECDFESREFLDKLDISGGGDNHADEQGEDESVVSKAVLMGHDREGKKRSRDVEISGEDVDVDFSDMQLSEEIIKGLKLCRYDKPTPIQLKAIPLGALNFDLLLQAKSGTGKTCVFTVCILQQIVVTDKFIQAIVVSPCREVAVQIAHVIKSIGAFKDGLKVKEFIGGTSVAQTIRRTKKCHIAVGTPGRLAHMIKEYEMDLSNVKVIALDEADKLMEFSFFDDIKAIFNALPEKKQLIATSATYSDVIVNFLEKFMKSAYKIQLDLDNPALCAVDQYMLDVKKIIDRSEVELAMAGTTIEEGFYMKYACLKEALRRIQYSQVIIFSNWQLRAEKIYDHLKDSNLDVELLSASRSQEDRLQAFTSVQQGRIKLLVATDVASRGIDMEGVDLVINFDVPTDSDTYLHRVGRTGRFGSSGKALSLCYFDNERVSMSEFQIKAHFTLWGIETKEELNGINKHEMGKQSNIRQLRSYVEPITTSDPGMENWKEIFQACMAMKLEDDNIEQYAVCSNSFNISYADVMESHEKGLLEFDKLIEERKNRRLALAAAAAAGSSGTGEEVSADDDDDDDDVYSSDEEVESVGEEEEEEDKAEPI